MHYNIILTPQTSFNVIRLYRRLAGLLHTQGQLRLFFLDRIRKHINNYMLQFLNMTNEVMHCSLKIHG